MNDNLKEFKDYLQYEKKFPSNTILSYISDISFFLNYLKSIKKSIKLVDKILIRDYLKVLDSLNYKPSTISRNLSSLRSYFDFLLINKEIKYNSFNLIKNPKKEKKLPNFLTYKEFEEVINSIPQDNEYYKRNILIFELLFATGIRVSELVNIKLRDIDLNNNSIKVLGKGGKERIVYFGEYAKNALISYLDNSRSKLLKNKKSEYLLINNKSTKLTREGVYEIIVKSANIAKLKHAISPHVMRHTFATSMLNNGADIRSVQELLGHESLSTTQIYTHVTSDILKSEYLKNFPRK